MLLHERRPEPLRFQNRLRGLPGLLLKGKVREIHLICALADRHRHLAHLGDNGSALNALPDHAALFFIPGFRVFIADLKRFFLKPRLRLLLRKAHHIRHAALGGGNALLRG